MIKVYSTQWNKIRKMKEIQLNSHFDSNSFKIRILDLIVKAELLVYSKLSQSDWGLMFGRTLM